MQLDHAKIRGSSAPALATGARKGLAENRFGVPRLLAKADVLRAGGWSNFGAGEKPHTHLGQWHLCALDSVNPVFGKDAFEAIGYNRAMKDVTRILTAIECGDENASAKLLPLVYQELRKLASAKLSKEKPGQTLQPTMLVHEAYVRLVDVDQPQQWNGRGHFFGAAAEAMRRILVEKARQRQSRKRAHVVEHAAVNELAELPPVNSLDLLALDEALTEFERRWPEKANLVKLRYFAGLTTKEAADAMGMSVRTAERTWTYAKAWLLQAIEGSGKLPD